MGHLSGKLGAVLEHIQNNDFPTLMQKLTYLFHSACMFHCFEDGNKRIAINPCAKCYHQRYMLISSEKLKTSVITSPRGRLTKSYSANGSRLF